MLLLARFDFQINGLLCGYSVTPSRADFLPILMPIDLKPFETNNTLLTVTSV